MAEKKALTESFIRISFCQEVESKWILMQTDQQTNQHKSFVLKDHEHWARLNNKLRSGKQYNMKPSMSQYESQNKDNFLVNKNTVSHWNNVRLVNTMSQFKSG